MTMWERAIERLFLSGRRSPIGQLTDEENLGHQRQAGTRLDDPMWKEPGLAGARQ